MGNSAASWTRRYDYGPFTGGVPNTNRLRSTSVPGDTPGAVPYSAQLTHDAHGNITSMAHLASIAHDHAERMRQADLGGGGTAYYVYNADGTRARKVIERIGTLVEERIYLGGWEVYRKRDHTGLLLERETLHVMDDRRRIAMVETKTVDTSVSGGFTPVPRQRFQLDDHIWSARLELDETGLVISAEEFHPYGTSAYRSTRSGVEVSERRFRYTGKERDEETGFQIHGLRYYCPWLGRWTTADPIGLQGGVNQYAYCRGDPVGKVDPGGTFDFGVGGMVSTGVDELQRRDGHASSGSARGPPAERTGKTVVSDPADERVEEPEDPSRGATIGGAGSEPEAEAAFQEYATGDTTVDPAAKAAAAGIFLAGVSTVVTPFAAMLGTAAALPLLGRDEGSSAEVVLVGMSMGVGGSRRGARGMGAAERKGARATEGAFDKGTTATTVEGVARQRWTPQELVENTTTAAPGRRGLQGLRYSEGDVRDALRMFNSLRDPAVTVAPIERGAGMVAPARTGGHVTFRPGGTAQGKGGGGMSDPRVEVHGSSGGIFDRDIKIVFRGRK